MVSVQLGGHMITVGLSTLLLGCLLELVTIDVSYSVSFLMVTSGATYCVYVFWTVVCLAEVTRVMFPNFSLSK